MFWAGLTVGLGLSALCLLALFLAGAFKTREAQPAYGKILVAAVENPFSRRALNMGVRMAGRTGIVETLYVIEIGVERPLEVPADEAIAAGLSALEEASYIAKNYGKKLLPRLEKARMASRVILDTQAQGGFDLLIMDLAVSNAMEATTRKIAQYIEEKATCTVVILSGKQKLLK